MAGGVVLNQVAVLVFVLLFGVILVELIADAAVSRSLGTRARLVGTVAALLPLALLIPGVRLGIPPRQLSLVFVLFLVLVLPFSAWLAFSGMRLRQPHARWRARFFLQLILTGAVFALAPTATLLQGYVTWASLMQTYAEPWPECPKNGEWLIAHLSDSHVSAGLDTADGGVPGQNGLTEILSSVSLARPSFIVLSGDVTDRGSAWEWEEAVRRIGAVSSDSRVVLVPGNHDLSIAYEEQGSADFDALGAGLSAARHRRLHLGRYIAAQARLFPGLKTTTGATFGDLAAAASREPASTELSHALKQINPCFTNCVLATAGEGGKSRGTFRDCTDICEKRFPDELATIESLGAFEEQWDEASIFPASFVDSAAGIAILAINSAPPSADSLGESAIGEVDDLQIARARSWFENLTPAVTTVGVTLHHTLVRRERDRFTGPTKAKIKEQGFFVALGRSDWWAYSLLRHQPAQARKFLELLLEFAGERRILILWGHRHDRSYERLGATHGVFALEAPNTGDPKGRGYFLVGSDSIGFCTATSQLEVPRDANNSN